MSFDTTPWLASAVLLLAGGAAGFVNTLAGGGSALTLPLLMLFGLPADVANGTNRVSVCAQCAVASWGFHRSGRLDLAGAAAVAAPTLLGSLGGAAAASYMPAPLLRPVLIGGLLLVAGTFVVRPPPALAGEPARPQGPRHWLALFAIGVYGGFLQAGVGFFLLAFLCGALRHDLVVANALKVVTVGAFTVVALGVFVLRDQVAWAPGLVLTAGTMIGAPLGVRFALRAPAAVMRRVVVVAIVVFALAALFKG